MTDHEIEGLLDEWHDDASGHSFEHTMLAGAAFNELMTVKDRLIPFLLRRLRDEDWWMGYQGLLRRLTKADIWEGDTLHDKDGKPVIRRYDVASSGRKWLEWGVKNKYITSTERRRAIRANRCYKCLIQKMEFSCVDDEGFNGDNQVEGAKRVIVQSCCDCGEIERTEIINDPESEYGHRRMSRRTWRGETELKG
jgi:hypothetical protein